MGYYHEYCDKNETLSKLYTLRVGMSLLSLEKDKFLKNKKLKADKENKSGAWREKALNEAKTYKERLKEKREEEQKENDFLARSKKLIVGRRVDILKSFLGGLALIILSVLLGYYYYLSFVTDMGDVTTPDRVAAISYNDIPFFNVLHKVYLFLSNLLLMLEDISFLFWTVGLIWILGLPVLIIVLVVLGGKAIVGGFELIGELVDLKARKLRAPAVIKMLEGEVHRLEIAHQNAVSQAHQLSDKLQAELVPIEQNMVESVRDSVALFKALEEQFSDFLQVVDWGNVDLLIHYFSTGRADNMKEALQQVDRQRQTEDIVRAVNNASRQICGTITQAFTQLQTSMAQNFVMLSQQLDLMHQQNQAQIAALSNKVKNLASSVAANQELQQKTNVGSLQLAEDIHYLRVSTEIRDIKARNNL